MKKNLKKNRLGYVILSIIFLLILSFFAATSNYLHLSRADKRFVDEALSVDWPKVKFESLIRSDEEQTCVFVFRIANSFYGSEKFNEIRCNLNNFLVENPNHYLNGNYKITIILGSPGSAKAIGLFQNYFEVKWLGIEEYYSGFYHFESYNRTNTLNKISELTVFNDLISLRSEGSFYGEDLSVIKKIPTLKYIEDKAITDEDQKQINQWLPNCMIINK